MGQSPAARAVASWARKAREALAHRDEAIIAMRAEGASLQEIAEVAEMTKAGVLKLLRRHDGA